MNPGWSLRDKAFVSALALSILWHCFWFFSISITVAHKKPTRAKPQIVSLGPVLDDSLFRTLLETKPELSEAFYRRLSDFSKPIDLEVKTMSRHSPGEVVSLPFGKRVLNSIKSLVGGTKSSLDTEFTSRLGLGYLQGIEGLEGEVKERPVLNRPDVPRLPAGFQASLNNVEIVLDFSVDADGSVLGIQTIVSSGNRAADTLWENYLRGWQFEALKTFRASTRQKGRIRFRIT
ncbi:MAG: hypothetical protein A3C47_05870 [Omnitrophica bacterium RIFCSPHIGHO2_02_FULL_51_18]|nr:MAG: hypothetical protein A3C47_05870 [Omnitrophica bacterium RIFCSPHIGHO2_02_FULL_51_18]